MSRHGVAISLAHQASQQTHAINRCPKAPHLSRDLLRRSRLRLRLYERRRRSLLRERLRPR